MSSTTRIPERENLPIRVELENSMFALSLGHDLPFKKQELVLLVVTTNRKSVFSSKAATATTTNALAFG